MRLAIGFCAAFASAAVWASSETAVLLSSWTAGAGSGLPVAGAVACCAKAGITVKKIRKSDRSCVRLKMSSSFQSLCSSFATLNFSAKLATSMSSTQRRWHFFASSARDGRRRGGNKTELGTPNGLPNERSAQLAKLRRVHCGTDRALIVANLSGQQASPHMGGSRQKASRAATLTKKSEWSGIFASCRSAALTPKIRFAK